MFEWSCSSGVVTWICNILKRGFKTSLASRLSRRTNSLWWKWLRWWSMSLHNSSCSSVLGHDSSPTLLIWIKLGREWLMMVREGDGTSSLSLFFLFTTHKKQEAATCDYEDFMGIRGNCLKNIPWSPDPDVQSMWFSPWSPVPKVEWSPRSPGSEVQVYKSRPTSPVPQFQSLQSSPTSAF